MSDISSLTRAAEALDGHGESEHARAVREYVRGRLGYWPRIYRIVKAVVMYVIVFGGTAVGFYGAYSYTVDGAYYAAIGILFVTAILYGIIALLDKVANVFERITRKTATGEVDRQ